MRTKKARKPTSPFQYVLSIDKSLKKLSLRRISASFKRAAKSSRRAAARSVRSVASVRSARRSSASSRYARGRRPVHSVYAPWTPSWQAIALLLVGGMTGVALFAERHPLPSQGADRRLAADPESGLASQMTPATAQTSAVVMPQTVAEVSGRSADGETGWVMGEPIANLEVSNVSITGCLEQGGDGFVLTGTSGDAPKSRSWKSGFLRKRSSRIDILDAGHTLMLSSYVGDRVTASGSLMDHELEVRSVRRVGTCE